MITVLTVGSPEDHTEWCASCFAVGVWRDHTNLKWCASCCNGGESREITPSGVLAVVMLGCPVRSH